MRRRTSGGTASSATTRPRARSPMRPWPTITRAGPALPSAAAAALATASTGRSAPTRAPATSRSSTSRAPVFLESAARGLRRLWPVQACRARLHEGPPPGHRRQPGAAGSLPRRDGQRCGEALPGALPEPLLIGAWWPAFPWPHAARAATGRGRQGMSAHLRRGWRPQASEARAAARCQRGRRSARSGGWRACRASRPTASGHLVELASASPSRAPTPGPGAWLIGHTRGVGAKAGPCHSCWHLAIGEGHAPGGPRTWMRVLRSAARADQG